MKSLMKKLAPWQIDAAGVGICVLLTLLLIFGGIQPLLSSRANFESQRQLLDQRSSHAMKLDLAKAQITNSLNLVRNTLEASPLRLSPATDVNLRLSQISSRATRSGLDINEIRPGLSAASSRYETIPVLLAGSGSFSRCTQFLRSLHEEFPDTAVRSLELIAGPIEPGRPSNATFSFDLRWHAAPGSQAP